MPRLSVISRNRPAIRFLVLAIFALGLGSCGETVLSPQPKASGEVSVAIRMGKVAAANISRAEIVVTGSGMTEMKQQLTISGNTISGEVTGIPAGSDRRFTLNGYDTSGALTYTGAATATVTAGQAVTVNIPVRRVGATSTGMPRLQIEGTATAKRRSDNITSITFVITNTGTADATNVVIKFRAKGSGGGPIDDAEVIVGTVEIGESKLVKDAVIFSGTTTYTGPNFVASAEYTLTYNEGSPITGIVTVQ